MRDGWSWKASFLTQMEHLRALYIFMYNYHVPFLKTDGIVCIQDKRIGPLYKHVFPPRLAPRLSFVGIPEKGFTFPMVECQSRWIACALSRKVLLPSEDEMLTDVTNYYQVMKENGLPEHHTHSLGFKTHYLEWVFAQSGIVMEKEIEDMGEYLIHCLKMAGYKGCKDLFLQQYGI
ncbi:hypothetical protein L2E82_41261 [Cichorium intybus]|uniref:Uncharacterized protein n=1 Tax=Cichorium intybus TaxID=13427 RepID=A0ACB9ANR9_CICIN|nr:hypothetical protein L2E82_41261 [Cichorium intybus]